MHPLLFNCAILEWVTCLCHKEAYILTKVVELSAMGLLHLATSKYQTSESLIWVQMVCDAFRLSS